MTRAAVALTMLGFCTWSCLVLYAKRVSAEQARYTVEVEAGLTPELSPSQIVPKVPGPFGSFRLGGTIESIERVALVRGQNVPRVDPALDAQETDVPVWVVIVRGKFYSSGPGDASSTFSRGAYLIHHRSGFAYQVGGLPDTGKSE